MDYYKEGEELNIDLSEESYDAKKLLKYKEVKSIRIRECVEQIELPEALKEYKALTEFAVSGKNDILYPPPLHLEKLTNIKKITFWNSCDLKKLKPMPHIETLVIITKAPFTDVQIASSIFPNLKSMRVWGSRLKSGELPPEIGSFKHLERLELVSCGLTDFPPELKKMKTLKSLVIGGLIMKNFPEMLCEMNWLENLSFGQKITALPDNFSKLKALKTLDFSWEFNGGITPVDKWSNKPIYLHPIPEVIGKLPALQALYLNHCGVVNLTFLKSPETLKKLEIKESGLANCNELSTFKSLEILSLEAAVILADIKGLAGLPIKILNLENCDELKSIDPILELTELEELNIDRCSKIEDFDAVYQHPNLKVLQASGVIKEQWELKDQLKNFPPLDTVINNLSSDDVALAEKAMNDLVRHVDKNYHPDNNPLARYFGKEADEEYPLDLPILDSAFKKYKNKLSIDTLIDLTRMSIQSINVDNYTITLLAIQEIIKRKDLVAQQQVIAQFNTYCGDFGHRFWDSSVQDQLFDDLFPAFETAALIDLLKDGAVDMLNSDGGDGGDRLFIPAFKKCKNMAELDSLLAAFFGYQDESLRYLGFQYFSDLYTEIRADLPKKYALKFKDEIKKKSLKTEVFILLESKDPKDIIKLIGLLDKEENKKFVKSKSYKILEKINELEVPLKHVTTALDFFIEKKVYVEDTILKYLLPNGKGAVIAYLKTKKNTDNKEYIGETISKIIHGFNIENNSMKEIQPFRNYLKEINNCSDDAVYTIEIKNIFISIKNTRFYNTVFYDQLSRLEEIASLVKSPPITLPSVEMWWDLRMIASGIKDWDIIKRLCKALFAIIPAEDVESSLQTAVISAAMTDDHNFLNFLSQYIPETTEDELLTFNLACAYAKFSEKEPMLAYIKRSIELGKTKAQFLDDNDFAQYSGDQDFLMALEPAT